MRLAKPQPLLLILDLNGTLLHRPNRSSSSHFVSRNDVAPFVAHILDAYHVMVWSSAKPENVELMCRKIFSPEQSQKVLLEWGRDKLINPFDRSYNQKTQVYKQLERVWNDPLIRCSHPTPDYKWSAWNTVLIDDSFLKASTEPHNIVVVPEFKGKKDGETGGANVLRQVAAYIDEARWYKDVSSYMRENPFQAVPDWNGASPLDGYGSLNGQPRVG
jgi:hypothetical protein